VEEEEEEFLSIISQCRDSQTEIHKSFRMKCGNREIIARNLTFFPVTQNSVAVVISKENCIEELVGKRTQELQRISDVKSRFLAIISHEIRTPLFGIMSTLSLLTKATLSEEERSLLQIGQVCGEQLLMVINDVLDFSKIDEAKMVLEKETFNLRQAIQDSLEVVFLDAEKKGLELLSDIDSNVPEAIEGDCRRFRQIVINLLSNAIKFAEKGEVILAVTSQDLQDSMCKIEISLSDQGIGMSEETVERLFQPFCQANSSMTRRFGGTGLGLGVSIHFCGEIFLNANNYRLCLGPDTFI
jgi:signal transduction histidine kinase